MKAGVAVATASFALAGVLALTVNPSGAVAYPMAFANESNQAAYPGFTANTLTDLKPQCPQGITGTPGSDPSTKFLNSALNTADSFKAGGTVHYSYIDNPNFASQNYTIQDCVAVYDESVFQAGDFDPVTGTVIPGQVSNSDLNSGTQVDGGEFSGVFDSTGSTYFNWTAPANLVGGQWVCNFARDISTGHGGGGNRKVLPSCYQVPKAATTTTTTSTSTTTTTAPPTTTTTVRQSTPPPPVENPTTTTTTTEAPTTTTTTSLPELPFTPEPEIITTTTAAPAPELAFTGSSTGYLTVMALVMIGFGGLLYAGSNRKRQAINR